jgi:tetratricopeptide (TPR) repeat protein
MKQQPDIAEVRHYLDVGFANLDEEASEEGIRLLSLRSFEPFGFGWTNPTDEQGRDRALEAGRRAAALARQIGRLDLESAALDGASSALLNIGMYRQIREFSDRRLEIAESLQDPWELGDIYGAGAWERTMLGDYPEAVRLGLLGRERSEGAEGLHSHCLNWAGASLFYLGRWDEALELFRDSLEVLGERGEDPPYFMMHLFGVAAFVYAARRDDRADGLLRTLDRARGSIHVGSVMSSYWLAWAAARRGEHERAWELVRDAQVETQVMKPFQDQIAAELFALTERWDEVPAFLGSSRTHAAEAGLLALPVHLDRLEGRLRLATGDPDRGLELLSIAHDGFDGLGATWERARTLLDLAGGRTDAGRSVEAQAALDAAAPDLERAGALIELERLRELSKAAGSA